MICIDGASCLFNLAHKLKRAQNVLQSSEVGETEIEVLLCET